MKERQAKKQSITYPFIDETSQKRFLDVLKGKKHGLFRGYDVR